ncbi:sodium:proton antiporter [Sporomusa sp.]|uniref:cation:proton antiporter n=1 Tax=Sporomusa sp. TaxID=2078658 RepID=UPI002CAE646D|nr:sodium:proton antiporter [Sporomusa sp.]HWR45384.1 sodium:proton antiporter [Sporomusa sp.]
MENNAIQTAHQVLITFSVILVAGALAGKVADKLKIPDVVLYLLIGIVIGPPGLGLIDIPENSVVNQLVLVLGASVLLFHGGIGVSFGVLKNVWLTLLLLSTVAVFVMVAIVGYTVHAVFGISLIYALLLGAVLASTDPATLVPIFLSVGVKERLAQTVISESAFNDATGAIVTFTLLGAIATGQFALAPTALKFVIMAGGGIIIGAIYGLLTGFLVSGKSQDIFAEYSQVLMLPLIIASYMTAEHFGASGFMSVFVAGLVLGNLDEFGWTMKENHHDEVHSFLHIASLLLRIAIFVLLGAHVDLAIVAKYLLPASIVVAVFIFIARPIVVLLCTLPDRKAKWEKNEILFMFWTRETGVIPAALVGMLVGTGIQHSDIISSVTFLAILTTLVLQATSTPWLARRLNLLQQDQQEVQQLHH